MSSVDIINSGLDVGSIVDGLISLERAPITRMQSQASSFQSKISAFQSLNSKLSSLLAKVDRLLYNGDEAPLSTPSTFEERFDNSVFSATKTTSSDEKVLKASAAAGAINGTYDIMVVGLAKIQTDLSSGFLATTTSIGDTGILDISVDGAAPVHVEINGGNNTLQGMMNAINDAEAGVKASIINDGTEAPYKLVINSSETGKANGYTITKVGWSGTALSFTNKVAADDAHLNVNGIDIYRGSNTISDVISGVTLNLNSASASPVTVTVAEDVDAMASAVRDLVAAYNEINTVILNQTRYNTQTKTAGVLAGDSTLRDIQTKLQSIVTRSVSNSHGSLTILRQIGIKFNNDGSLGFDDSKFRSAVANDLTSVAALLLGDGGTTGGSPTVDLHNALKSITDPLTGPIHNSTQSLSDNIKALNDRISDYQDRLAVRKELLTAEYGRADQAMRLMNMNQNSLSSQMASLSGLG